MAVKVMPFLFNKLSNFLNFNAVRGICHSRVCRMSVSACKLSSGVPGVPDSQDDDEIEAKQNVSRLPHRLRNKMNHVMKHPEPKPEHVQFFDNPQDRWTRRQRKIFAKHGWQSGVNPGIMWPSKEDLNEINEYEAEFEPSLQELWEITRKERDEEAKQIRIKEAAIDKGLGKMPEHFKNYRKKLQRKGQETLATRAKHRKLRMEAREYFGYNMDPRDPRFKQLKEQKVEEERLAKKAKVREEKSKLKLDRTKTSDLKSSVDQPKEKTGISKDTDS